MKDRITVHVKDLMKRIHDEEQDLQKKIDARIEYETEYLPLFFISIIINNHLYY